MTAFMQTKWWGEGYIEIIVNFLYGNQIARRQIM